MAGVGEVVAVFVQKGAILRRHIGEAAAHHMGAEGEGAALIVAGNTHHVACVGVHLKVVIGEFVYVGVGLVGDGRRCLRYRGRWLG